MMMQMVGAFAEFERAMIRERTSAGLAAARAEGRVGGRRKKLDASKRREIAESVLTGRKSGADMVQDRLRRGPTGVRNRLVSAFGLIFVAVGVLLVFRPALMQRILPSGLQGRARVIFSWFFFACSFEQIVW